MKIAICGGICSGKSTLAKILADKYNLQVYSFATSVKQYATEIFGMNYKNRSLIQDFAEKMKEIDKDVWINMLDKRIDSLDNIVIDDLRFDNELEYLRNRGFIIVRINIEKIEQIKRLISTYPDTWREHEERLTHVSELNRIHFMVDIDIGCDETSYINLYRLLDNNRDKLLG